MYEHTVFRADKTKIEDMDFRVWQMERARSLHEKDETDQFLLRNRQREIVKH